MMEIKSHALEGVRRSDKRFSSEGGGLSPSISTGLSLGVNGMDDANTISSPPNTGYTSSVISMRTPLPNATGSFGMPPMGGTAVNGSQSITPPPPLVPVGDGDFMSLSPPGIISRNQAVFLPPSIELPPFVSVTGVGSIPIMAPEVPTESQNEAFVSRQSMQNLARDLPSDTAMMADPQLSMATGPASVEAVKPDLNSDYNDSETQMVSDTQEVDVMDLPLAGETQPINDSGFDDMVVLQNDTLAASTMPSENGDQPASLFEPLQIVNTPPLEAPLILTTSTPCGITESKVSPTHQEYDRGKGSSGVEPHTDKLSSGDPGPTSMREGLNESLLHTEGPAANEGQASKEEGLDISEPQGGLLETVHDRTNKEDESVPSQKGNAGNAGSGKKKVVSEKDIKEIVGRKVLKKFGRKNYKGEVLDFDSENQWFKVVYEDGDQEDLELVEVKDILKEETLANTSTAKRKRPLAKGGPKKRARKQKQPKGQGQDGGRSRGRPRKKAASLQTTKKSAKVKFSAGSKREGPDTESSPRKGSQSELQSQKTSGGKRRRSADEDTEHRTKTEDKAENGGKTRSSSTKKSMGKSPPKKKGGRKVTKTDSAKKKTRRRSLSQLPAEQKKNVSHEKTKGKRQKVDAPEDEEALVGKTVEKDFDGILYKGKVTKFDKETLYFKVKYEDGDQEDLELEELKAVLVQ